MSDEINDYDHNKNLVGQITQAKKGVRFGPPASKRACNI